MGEANVGTAMSTGSHSLKKHKIGVFTVVFMIFSLVAAGCYGIEDMIPEAGPGLSLVMLMVLPLIWGLPFGLVASELGGVRPQEGGYYKWVQEGLGEFWGFQAGWWRTISIYIDNTLYVVLAGEYLGGILNMNEWTQFAFKAAMILFFMWLNIRGVRDVGTVTNILSIFVIAAFAMIAIIGFINWNGNPFSPFLAGSLEAPSDLIFFVGGGISVGMWMYSGYESMSTIAGELQDPQVISKATLITVPLIAATYILPTMASLAAFKGEGAAYSFENWGTEADSIGYATVANHFVGPALGIFFGIVAVVAQFSIYNTYIASGSRGFFTLAEDHLSPKFLAKVSKKHGVPVIAVVSVAIVNLILCNLDFHQLIVVDVFLLVSSYILVYIVCLILRRRIPKEEYKFRIPGPYWFLCVICIVPIIVAVISFFINGSDYFIGGMVGIITGPILYFIWKRMYGGLSKNDPKNNPLNPRTRLAAGDLWRITIILAVLAVLGACGSLFLPWYESEWVFPGDYDMTLFGSKAAMFTGIKIASAILAVLAIVFAILAKNIEKKR